MRRVWLAVSTLLMQAVGCGSGVLIAHACTSSVGDHEDVRSFEKAKLTVRKNRTPVPTHVQPPILNPVGDLDELAGDWLVVGSPALIRIRTRALARQAGTDWNTPYPVTLDIFRGGHLQKSCGVFLGLSHADPEDVLTREGLCHDPRAIAKAPVLERVGFWYVDYGPGTPVSHHRFDVGDERFTVLPHDPEKLQWGL